MREGHSGWSDWALSVLMVLSAVSCLHQLSFVDSSVSGNVLIRGCEVDQLVRRQCVARVVCFRVRKRDEQFSSRL